MTARALRRALVAAVLAVTPVVAVVPSGPAGAVEGTLPGNAATSWQTNGSTRALAYAAGRVFLGGLFTSVRPPGQPAGSGEVARSYFAAFSSSTGALDTSFPKHTLNGAVYATATYGGTVYVGGDFTTIDGTTRNRVAAFNATTGALLPWNPNASGRVASIVPTASSVYLGGSFTRVGGAVANRLSEVNATTGGRVTAFSASADSVVYALALSPDGRHLYVAGGFSAVTGGGRTSDRAAADLDPATGAVHDFPAAAPATGVIPPKTDSCVSVMKTVTTDGTAVYFGAEGTGGGCFDGTFSALSSDGSLRWVSRCLGATQGLTVIDGVLYEGSHSHDCSADAGFDPDAFPEVGWALNLHRHLTARDAATGRLTAWLPNTNGGPGSGSLGPRVMATDGSQLFLGGEFTTVNGVKQQGFTRFSPSTGDRSAPARPSRPMAVARPGGKVSVFVQAPTDIDDASLTVRLYRDGGSTPIATQQVRSLFWRTPVAAFEDNGLALGSKHTYTADAVETNGTNVSARSVASTAVTVVSSVPSYQAAVTQDDPTLYWRLGETSGGTVAGDASDGLAGGLYSGGSAGVTFGQPGAVGDANTAIATNGSTGYVSSSQRTSSPGSFTAEAWIRTTTTRGGKIIGFGDRQMGYDFNGNAAVSTSYDKHVYMTDNGRLVFGVWTGSPATATSTASYNDGQWHHVVATQGSSGMALYVDGARVARNSATTNQPYDGYWRVGGDNLGGWPDQPSSSFFAGSIDEVAVYDHALSLPQVQAHYAASGRTPPATAVPTDAYGRLVYGDAPSTYWRLDDTGATAADASGNDNSGDYVGGVTEGTPGALGSTGTGATLDGVDGGVVSHQADTSPSSYSLELWFDTTSTSGGKLIGFGDAARGSSSAYDKHVYLTDDGRLVFGVWTGSPTTVTSPAGFNDGHWHHVVATQGADGMRLYVDGQLVDSNTEATNQAYTGYWRVGGDNLNAWPDQPASGWLAGSVDEVAIYPSVVSAAQVQAHYTAGTTAQQ